MSLLFAKLHWRHFSNLDLIPENEKNTLVKVSFKRENKRNVFSEVSISQLKFIGTFLGSQIKSGRAIIQKADKEINTVEIGDTLGAERYVVTAINLKKIIIQDNNTKKIIQLLL